MLLVPMRQAGDAAALIETRLRGGLEIGGRRQRVKPGDIAMLYPRRRPDAAVTALCDRLNGRCCRPATSRLARCATKR
jgi:hypothetical protein